MTEKVTTYLCSKTFGAVGHEGLCSVPAITEGPNKAVAELIRTESVPGCHDGMGKIEVELLGEDESPYCSLKGELSWKRATLPVSAGEPILLDYITVTYSNPEHCQWEMTDIVVAGATDQRLFISTFPDTSLQGAIPESKSDVIRIPESLETHLVQNQIVPGELMTLLWYFGDGQNTTEQWVDEKWYCSCCLTGGKVKAVNGSYEDENITYTVNIQGVARTCRPSDFVEWAVGDWVFILSIGSACDTCGRTQVCNEDCGVGTDLIILPLKIGNYGS